MYYSDYLVRVSAIKPSSVTVGGKLTVEGVVYFRRRKQLEKRGFPPCEKMSFYEAGDRVINRPRLFVDIFDGNGKFFDTQAFVPRTDGEFSFVVDTRGYPKEGGRYVLRAFYGEGEDGQNVVTSEYCFELSPTDAEKVGEALKDCWERYEHFARASLEWFEDAINVLGR